MPLPYSRFYYGTNFQRNNSGSPSALEYSTITLHRAEYMQLLKLEGEGEGEPLPRPVGISNRF